MAGTSKDDETASDLIRTVSRHSLAYMLCAASEMFRHYDFDPLDLLIIHAVLNANVLNVMKTPNLIADLAASMPSSRTRSSRAFPVPRSPVFWPCPSKPSADVPID
jgi:hypothetical protein